MIRDIMIQCLNSDIETLKGLLNRGIPTEDKIKTEIETKTAIIELLKADTCKRKGKWELSKRGKSFDIVCSECHHVRYDDVWYNCPMKAAKKEFDTLRLDKWCLNCGADMRGEKDESSN